MFSLLFLSKMKDFLYLCIMNRLIIKCMKRIISLFVFCSLFLASSAQTIVYDNINKESGFRMIATSQELCPL